MAVIPHLFAGCVLVCGGSKGSNRWGMAPRVAVLIMRVALEPAANTVHRHVCFFLLGGSSHRSNKPDAQTQQARPTVPTRDVDVDVAVAVAVAVGIATAGAVDVAVAIAIAVDIAVAIAVAAEVDVAVAMLLPCYCHVIAMLLQ